MDKLFPSKDAAEGRLLILYILTRLETAINNLELTDYVLEERLMEYMDLQQHVNELIEDKLIAAEKKDGIKYYVATKAGAKLVAEMPDLLPQTEKNRVDRTFAKQKRGIKDSRSVTAEYMPDDERGGVARIGLNEGGVRLLNLEIAVASKEEALLICANWKGRTVEIYQSVVGLLLGKPDEHC